MNVFIDCGYYCGKAIKLFRKTIDFKDDFVFYAFDASFNRNSKDKLTFLNKAVWIYDGEIEFYKSYRRGGKANGLFHNKRARKETTIKVECIDFSSWILKTFTKNDYIILKMDIEGAETEVLNKMLHDGSIDYIKIAYIEFHNKKEETLETRRKLSEINGIQIRPAIEICWNKYTKVILK